MLNNCFTFSCQYLENNGIEVPRYFKGMDRVKDHNKFIKQYQSFLDNDIHYHFFESFCDYVNAPKKNDIILDDNSVGVVINAYKYISIYGKTMKPKLFDIDKTKKILRTK